MRCQWDLLPDFTACGEPAELCVDEGRLDGRVAMRLCRFHMEELRWREAPSIRRASEEEAHVLEVMLR